MDRSRRGEAAREERGVWCVSVNFKGSLARGRSVPSDGEDRHDEDAPKGGEPSEEPTEAVASGGEDGVYANYANVLPSALACLRTISRPASRTCGSRSRTVASQGR
jgi:hypothetical protein